MKMNQNVTIGFILFLSFLIACTKPMEKEELRSFKFPEDWYGSYSGELKLWNAEKGNHMSLPMVLEISKTEDSTKTRWYSSSKYMGKDVIKDYVIITHDSLPKNHFLMDENNGIYLDHVLLDDAFYDYFEVSGTGLYGITRRVPEGIEFEIASFPLGSPRYSRYNGYDFSVDTIISYPVINTQKVVLTPIDSKK